MSQLTRIVGVRIVGAAYLGQRTRTRAVPSPGTPAAAADLVDTWSSDGDEVMTWLCDASRHRFNQHRSTRSKYVYEDGVRVLDEKTRKPLLVPIGATVDQKVDSAARREHPHLAAVPSMIMQGQREIESSQWFAAVKRRKTNLKAGRPAGAMPRFRAMKHTDLTLSCWHHMGAAKFVKTGRRTGLVTINGINPAGKRGLEPVARWSLRIKVRFSADTRIRDYTSVKVNWSRKTLSFTNVPLPVRRETSGRAGGFDAGAAHTLADELGNFYDAPDTTALDLKRKQHQRRMAKSRAVAQKQGRNQWESNRYQRQKTAAADLSAKITRIRVDFAHKVTTRIVRECDLIAIEDLKLRNMTRSAKGTKVKPGSKVKQKSGLNRVMNAASLGRIREFLTYKAKLAQVPMIAVNPRNTSRQCRECGHTAKENRESQAVFSCANGHTANADTNAAGNIRDSGLTMWLTRQLQLEAETVTAADTVTETAVT